MRLTGVVDEVVDTAPLEPLDPALARPSIAVLPVQNMSGDPEQDYFADGISEDITTALAKNRWLRVVARNPAFAFRNEFAVGPENQIELATVEPDLPCRAG